MNEISKQSLVKKILLNAPIIVLFISVLSNFDFNYLDLDYFSFNFIHILIFYCGLKKNINLGYGLIFLAGLINDTVINLPIGLSSLSYLLICVSAAYLRTITLRPSLSKDIIYFLVTILVVNSISYTLLNLIFSITTEYKDLLINVFFTFLLYFVFANLFKLYEIKILRRSDV
jgi:hypothetical protein|tara:strand:- start:517 stop:1035 length:519 start_codon:yes stop_codon:yes gene_type:complete